MRRAGDELIYDEIAARRAAGGEERDDVLSLLLQARHEDGSPMTDQELRDELMTLLVAGHETTATALAWALERLVRHPDALERLREEPTTGTEYADAVVQGDAAPASRSRSCCGASRSRWRSAAACCPRA